MIDFKTAQVRRHQQNLERYCRLLATELTNLQRQYLHKRIAEEYAQLKRLEKAAFRATAWQDDTRVEQMASSSGREGERKSGFEVGNKARIHHGMADRRRDCVVNRPASFLAALRRCADRAGKRRWLVRAIQNLVTGEQYLLDWNGRRLRIDPAQDPCAAVPLSCLEDPT